MKKRRTKCRVFISVGVCFVALALSGHVNDNGSSFEQSPNTHNKIVFFFISLEN